MENIDIKEFMKKYNYKKPEHAAEHLLKMVMTGTDLDFDGNFTLSHIKNTTSVWWDNGDDLACSSNVNESLTRLTAIIEYAIME